MIPLAGVIGDPVAHSRSPRLHGHWLRRYGLPGAYVPLRVARADLPAVLDLLPRLGFVGLNVTLPHKQEVLARATRVSEAARRIGSANTLTFERDGILAENTDAPGFAASLVEGAPGHRPRRAAVLGAGGAARAVIVALQDLGAVEIRIANRSPERARTLADEFGLLAVAWDERAAMLEGCDTLVNATSLGMAGGEPLDIGLDRLPVGAVVTDLVYTPLETALLAQARRRGHRVVDGLGMLLHQAAPGFARWFGRMPEVDADLREAVLA